MIKDKSIQIFLDELAGKSSTPGGGSAAAIIGAMGAALISMVANFTVGKKGYEEVDADARDILEKSEKMRTQLTGMIKADVDVFNRVMGAYGLPKETDEQKAARSREIQAALKEATDVPLACARLAAEVIKLSLPIAEKGNKNVISDAGVAVVAGQAALKSAALNVYINIGGIRDESFASDRKKQLEDIMAGMDELTDKVYELVKSKL